MPFIFGVILEEYKIWSITTILPVYRILFWAGVSAIGIIAPIECTLCLRLSPSVEVAEALGLAGTDVTGCPLESARQAEVNSIIIRFEIFNNGHLAFLTTIVINRIRCYLR